MSSPKCHVRMNRDDASPNDCHDLQLDRPDSNRFLPRFETVSLENYFKQQVPQKGYRWIRSEDLISHVCQIFEQDEQIHTLLYQNRQGELEGIFRTRVQEQLAKPLHFDLFINRTVEELAKTCMQSLICVQQDRLLQDAVVAAMAREGTARYEPIVVMAGKDVVGVVEIHGVLNELCRLTQENVTVLEEQKNALVVAEKQRQRMQEKLVTASRRAGKAEIATSILHNVGNVLNSVSTTVSTLNAQLQRSKVQDLTRLHDLFIAHQDNWSALFEEGGKGPVAVQYLETVADRLVTERKHMLHELNQLTLQVDHMAQVVSQQQSYAKNAKVCEQLNVRSVIDDALQMVNPSVTRHKIDLRAHVDPELCLISDRNLLLQVVVNLITNACQAARDGRSEDRRVTVHAKLNSQTDQSAMTLVVTDNGIGIPKENLDKIFAYGFTTKEDGSGFGLHNAANTCKQLDGELEVFSEGPGCGAQFSLTLPVKPTEREQVSESQELTDSVDSIHQAA